MTIWNDYAHSEVRQIIIGAVNTRIVVTPRIGRKDSRAPILMVHGRGGHLESFHRNVRALSAHRSVISVDLLGHGLTAHAGTRYDISEITSHLGRVMTHLDDGRGLDVVAQSLGAWAIMRLTASGVVPTRRMVLIEPAGLQTQVERMSDDRVRAAAAAGGRAFDDPSIDNVRLRFAQLLHDPASVDDEMVHLRQRLYSLPGAGAVHHAVRNADNEGHVVSREYLAAADPSVLFIRGEYGHLPPSTLERVAEPLTSAAVVTIPAAKQWPHYEQPDLVNSHIIDHLER